jgi:hypothetical protein
LVHRAVASSGPALESDTSGSRQATALNTSSNACVHGRWIACRSVAMPSCSPWPKILVWRRLSRPTCAGSTECRLASEHGRGCSLAAALW